MSTRTKSIAFHADGERLTMNSHFCNFSLVKMIAGVFTKLFLALTILLVCDIFMWSLAVIFQK